MDAKMLAEGLAVEYVGDEDEVRDGVGLFHGHPGRVSSPEPEDVFVEWVAREAQGDSVWMSYELSALAPLSEEEFAARAVRVRSGQHPLASSR